MIVTREYILQFHSSSSTTQIHLKKKIYQQFVQFNLLRILYEHPMVRANELIVNIMPP